MLLIARYVTLVLVFSVLLTVYLITPTTTPASFKPEAYHHKRNVKNIVAYSFRKKIELDRKEVICERLEGYSRVSTANFEKLNKPNSYNTDSLELDLNYSAIYSNKVKSGIADYVKGPINELVGKNSTRNQDSATTVVREFDKLNRYEAAAVEDANYSIKNNAFDNLDSWVRVGGHLKNETFTTVKRNAATIENVRNGKNKLWEKNNRATVEPDVAEKHHWVKIPNSAFYAYSAYLDRRLDPYHYIRVIGMVEGE